jgi:hypothetical protein
LTGISSCRVGYLCDLFVEEDGGRQRLSDGGFPSTGYCHPRCDNNDAGCNYGLTCMASGYCL